VEKSQRVKKKLISCPLLSFDSEAKEANKETGASRVDARRGQKKKRRERGRAASRVPWSSKIQREGVENSEGGGKKMKRGRRTAGGICVFETHW